MSNKSGSSMNRLFAISKLLGASECFVLLQSVIKVSVIIGIDCDRDFRQRCTIETQSRKSEA